MGLLSALIDPLADRAAEILAARRSREPRYPDASRVPYIGRTAAGIHVTPDSAVCVAAVWACLRYLSQTVAMLPWRVMRETDSGSEKVRSHPVDRLLHRRPNPEWSSFQFRETLLHWALRWGNGYAEIEPDMVGRPFALWPIHPERVMVEREVETGALAYRVDNGSDAPSLIPPERMFHLRGFGEGPIGVNVIQYAAESIGWARAVQLFGAAFFGNGLNVGGVVEMEKSLSERGLKRLKEELKTLYAGPRRAGSWPVLDNGMKFKPAQLEPEKAQMLGTQEFLVAEVCRWFGVPPHKVMQLVNAHYNNVEQQAIEVVVDSITPWAKRFEDEADAKLFGQNRPGFYTKINLRGLLRGAFKEQMEGLEVMRRNGALSADEWRDLLEMNALPSGAGGDKVIVQAQYTTLEKIGEATPAPETSAPSALSEASPTEDEDAPEMRGPVAPVRAAFEAMAADCPSLEPADA